MPLVRYEIRNEHSLANPQLYRTASNDDPEGLLEGVAMAGLVGIVRQLGDLAEFAAEVFRDLHEEVMATASRGHELLARVQQLEAEIPAVEKALLSETNQLRFAYTPGAEWHANIRNDQNHCTQGDLPRFIRNSYEECRGPPRLFLLDKFDVAGAGACLKRYTDPSFFRTEWANSELMKAERVQRDKRAKREKKKGRRRRNGDLKESIPVDQLHARFSHELSKELIQSDALQPRMRHQPVAERSEEASLAADNLGYRNPSLSPQSRWSPEAQNPVQNMAKISNAPDSKPVVIADSLAVVVPSSLEDHSSVQSAVGSVSTADIKEECMEGKLRGHADEVDAKDSMNLESQVHVVTDADDGGSEGEQFVDALATIESEIDAEYEPQSAQDALTDANMIADPREVQSPLCEDVRSSGVNDSSFHGIVSPPLQDSPKCSQSDLSGSTVYHSNITTSGQDAKELSSVVTSIHTRRLSSESISSSSIAKAEHSHSSGSSIKCDKPVIHSRNLKGSINAFEEGSMPSLGAGVKVSMMVAAIEKGSLDKIRDEEIQNITLEAIPESLLPSVDVNEDQSTDNYLAQECCSPYLLSPERREGATKAMSPQLHGSSLRRIRVDEVSPFSSHQSQGSGSPPPDSPVFSALHSPMSPIRTSRNVLSSPDSQRLGFASEFLGPGSPTSVPVLALSPTSQARPPPAFFPLEWDGDEDTNPLNVEDIVTMISSLPSGQFDAMLVENPLLEQASEIPDAGTQSEAGLKILHVAVDPLVTVAQNSSDLSCLPPARSLDDFTTAAALDGFVSQVSQVSDDFEELQETLVKVDDVVHDSTAVECNLSTTPKTPNMQYSSDSMLVSPGSPNNTTIDSRPDYADSDQAIYQLGVKSPMDPVIALSSTPSSPPLSSPSPSSSLHEFSPPLSLNNGQDLFIYRPQIHLRSVESPSTSSASENLHEGPPFATPGVVQSVFPVEAPQDIVSSPSSKLVQDLLISAATSSKTALESSVPASKLMDDHRKVLPPSRTLRDLPTPTPPSKSQQDFHPPPPPPSQAPPPLPRPYELPLPPPAAKQPAACDVQGALLDAITSHDKSMLKKVKTMQNPTLRKAEDRSHLLEQIRAQSFNLRHTVVAKADPPAPRPMTNINVAAILEKANAIRQAFAGSDEDDDENDDWSDM